MSMTQLGRVVAGEDPRLRRYQRIELDMESFLVWFKSLDGVIRPEGHGLPKDFNVIAVQTRFDMAGRHMVDITIESAEFEEIPVGTIIPVRALHVTHHYDEKS